MLSVINSSLTAPDEEGAEAGEQGEEEDGDAMQP
jgi:hypothetical protein